MKRRRRSFRRLVGATGLALVALFVGLALNTWRQGPRVVAVEPIATPALDRAALARRLGAAIAIPTISPTPEAPELDAFEQLHALLQHEFPRVHASLNRETVARGSLLYRWDGRADCAPLLLLAHQDVVPVEPGTENEWRRPPFSGTLADDAIWGRGALDDKASLLAILEAVEHLLGEGFTPACPVYLAFGHDEEIGGEQGAASLAVLLQQRGVRPAYVLDEGGATTHGTFPGLSRPLATIGVAEKGYLSLTLRSRSEGGHSSMPPAQTAIGRLARAVARLEERRPPAELSAVQRELLRRIAPHLAFAQRLILSNLWLTAPLVEHLFASSPAADATLRTTTAPTVFRAGVKDNVLPQHAEAVVNFRLRPGDSVETVLAHVRDTLADAQIEIEVQRDAAREPTAPAPWDDPAFVAIERALLAVSMDNPPVVAPYVSNGGTDARHYAILTPKLYRFLPYQIDRERLATMHGSNERLELTEYLRMVNFYWVLLRDFGHDAG